MFSAFLILKVPSKWRAVTELNITLCIEPFDFFFTSLPALTFRWCISSDLEPHCISEVSASIGF